MFKLILALGLVAGLLLSNPALDSFVDKMQQQIDEQRSTMRASLGFVRDITGLSRLRHSSGASSSDACRLNLYIGSIFLLKHSTMGQAEEATALGVGALGQVFVASFEEEEEGGALKMLADSLLSRSSLSCQPFFKG